MTPLKLAEEECADNPKIVAVYLINPSDMTMTKDGTWRMKRKYGKFKRKVYKIKPSNP